MPFELSVEEEQLSRRISFIIPCEEVKRLGAGGMLGGPTIRRLFTLP